MHKTTILLDEDVYQALRNKAHKDSSTMGKIIRDLLREELPTREKVTIPTPTDDIIKLVTKEEILPIVAKAKELKKNKIQQGLTSDFSPYPKPMKK